jgi:hypothetical protein
LNAVDELDRCGVAILGEERDGNVASLDSLEDIAYGFIHKEGILDFILRLLTITTIKPFYDIGVVGLTWTPLLDALVVAVALCLTLLEKGGNFGGSHELLRLGGQVLMLREGQVVILQLLLDVEFVELIVDGVVGFFGD